MAGVRLRACLLVRRRRDAFPVVRVVSLLLAAFCIAEATAFAQQQRLGWDYEAGALRLVQFFSVVWDGVGNSVGLPGVKNSSAAPTGIVTFSVAMPALAPGKHTVRVDPCNASGCSMGTEMTLSCAASGCAFGDTPPTPAAEPTQATAEPATAPASSAAAARSSDTMPAPAAPPKGQVTAPKPQPSPAQPGGESADGTTVEDTEGRIVDARGDQWSLVGSSAMKSLVRNGQGVGGDGIRLIYKKHVVYLFTGSWYYRWNGNQLASFGPNPP